MIYYAGYVFIFSMLVKYSKRNVERWLTGEAVREVDLDPSNLPPWEQPPVVEEDISFESPKLDRKKYPYISCTPDFDRRTFSKKLTFDDEEETFRRSLGRAKSLGLERKEEPSNEVRVGLGRADYRQVRKLRESNQAPTTKHQTLAHREGTGFGNVAEDRFGARGPGANAQKSTRETSSKPGSGTQARGPQSNTVQASSSKSDHRQKFLTDSNSQAEISIDMSDEARLEDLSPVTTAIVTGDKTSHDEEDDHFNSFLQYLMPTPIDSNVIEYYLLQSGPLKPDLFYILPIDEAANEFIAELAALSDQFAEHFDGRPLPQNWSTEVKSLPVGTYLAIDCKDEASYILVLLSFSPKLSFVAV